MKKIERAPLIAIGLFFLSSGAVFAETVVQTRTLTFSIKPVFSVLINADSGGARYVDLGPVIPNHDTPLRSVQVTVVSNTRQRYRIFHKMEPVIESAENGAVSSERVLYGVTNGKRGGRSLVEGLMPVPSGETPIFESDPSGAAETFLIQYAVKKDKILGAGSYQGRLEIWAVPEG